MSCDRERRVADVPDFLLLGLVLDEVAGVALRLHLVDQRGGLGGGFVGAGRRIRRRATHGRRAALPDRSSLNSSSSCTRPAYGRCLRVRSASYSRTSGTASAAREDIREANDRQRALGRIRDQVQGRAENDHASGFRADQSAGDVHTFVRRELVQILIAGDAARDLRINLSRNACHASARKPASAIQLRTPAAARHQIAELSGRPSAQPSCANRHK